MTLKFCTHVRLARPERLKKQTKQIRADLDLQTHFQVYCSAFSVSFGVLRLRFFLSPENWHVCTMVAPAHQRKKNERNRCPRRPTSTKRPATLDAKYHHPLSSYSRPKRFANGAMTVKCALFVLPPPLPTIRNFFEPYPSRCLREARPCDEMLTGL